MQPRIKPIIVEPKTSIRDAMRIIDEAGRRKPPAPWGIVLVTDKKNRLIGVVTDGDIRRAILSGRDLRDPVSTVMTREPLTVPLGASASDMLASFHREIRRRGASEHKFHHVLIVDEKGAMTDVLTPFELWRRSEVKTRVAAVIGLGYVGLTLALTLNEFGIQVVGIDASERVVKSLKKGVPHFFEKGLQHLLEKHTEKMLFVKQRLEKHESDIYIVCVGTPVDERGKIITSFLHDAVKDVGRVLKQHDLVILRSTVPIGTCRELVIPLLEEESGLSAETDFAVAFAPERTVEGKALEELRTLPQVIGGYDKRALDETSRFFQIFAPLIVPASSLEESEAVKLLNNGFRDVSFAFANEFVRVCDRFGLNARRAIRAANEGYPRNPIPSPSPGVGGACLVKDPYLLAASAKKVGIQMKLPTAARAINTSMIDFVCEKVERFLAGNPKDSKIFLLGMAFKGNPETSDIRFSTSVDIYQQLRKKFKNIVVYDAVASAKDLRALGAKVVENVADGFKDSRCALMLNNHPSFYDLDIDTLARSMRDPSMIFDPWGIYTKEQLAQLPDVLYAGL